MKRKLVIMLGDKKIVRNLCKEIIKVPQMFYKISEKQLLENVAFVKANLVANISIKFFKQHEDFLRNKFDIVIMKNIPNNIEKATEKLITEFYIISKDREELAKKVNETKGGKEC